MRVKSFFLSSVRFSPILFSFFFSGCHFYFNNPADPEAEDYIGYDLIPGFTKTVPAAPAHGAEIVFPALEWTACPGVSQYGVEIADSSDFNSQNAIFADYQLTGTTTSMVEYSTSTSWITGERDLALWELPEGRYWWRCNLKGEMTSDQWGDWSQPSSFIQKLRMKEMYWDWDEEDPNGIQRGFRYFYDLNGNAEKEINFLKFQNELTPRYLESQVTLFNGEGRITEELLFSTIDCKPDSLVENRVYLYVPGIRNRVERREKYLLVEKGVALAETLLVGEDVYLYEEGESDTVSSVTRYRLNRSTGKIELYFISLYREGLQVKTSFFAPSETDPSQLEVKYYYDLSYLKNYPTKPSRAVYYMRDQNSGEMNYYNDYIIDYNVAIESNEIVISLGRGENKFINTERQADYQGKSGIEEPVLDIIVE